MRRVLTALGRPTARAGRALRRWLAPVVRIPVTYLMLAAIYVVGEDRAIRLAVWLLGPWPERAAELERDLAEGVG